jgi:hypothetical protein
MTAIVFSETHHLRLGATPRAQRTRGNPMDASLLTLGLTAIGSVIWAVRQEGRINKHALELRLMREDLKYIRARIDRAIGGAR